MQAALFSLPSNNSGIGVLAIIRNFGSILLVSDGGVSWKNFVSISLLPNLRIFKLFKSEMQFFLQFLCDNCVFNPPSSF